MNKYNIFLVILEIYVSNVTPFYSAGNTSIPKELIYSINEESEVGSFVGNLKLDAERKLLIPSKQLVRFELYDESKPGRFRVDSESGKLYVSSRIDRELLCPQADITPDTFTSSTDEQKWFSRSSELHHKDCEIHLALLVNHNHWINVIVTVHDINDNQPYFPITSSGNRTKTYVVEVPESVPAGYEIPLANAKDADIGTNGVQTYTLRGEDLDPSLFSISYKLPFTLKLIILGDLDAEIKSLYKGELIACDGGSPLPKCGVQPIEISVSDRNDNRPVFNQVLYELQVDEAVEVGAVIIRLEATDADSGPYGQVHYRFGQPISESVTQHFSIDEISGELRLKAKLNAKDHQRFIVPVLAEDGGAAPLTGHTAVQINVNDINDHSPWIDFRIAQSTEQTSNMKDFVIHVTENQPNGTSLGFIITGDEDTGRNSEVTCNLLDSGHNFVLEHTNSAKGREMYRLSTNNTFDCESIPSGIFIIKILCTDHGAPQQSTERTLNIKIIDVNEFSPEFPQENRDVTIYVEEGKPPGTSVYRAQAFDKDASPKIHYFLSREAQPLFHIEADTGLLTNRIIIDREETPIIRFNIFATDKDSFDMEGNVSVSNVTMVVTDINDNAPEMTGQHVFEIVENRPGFSDLIGQLTAIDKDSGANGTIRYKMISVFGNDNIPRNDTFMIDNETGKLFTLKSLDRESQQRYFIHIILYDLGWPISLNTTEVITVNVLDENDHAPIWHEFIPYLSEADMVEVVEISKQPSRVMGLNNVHSLGLMNITGPLFQGQRLGQLAATDIDEIENANITYQLLASYFSPVNVDSEYVLRGHMHSAPSKLSDLIVLERITGELIVGNEFRTIAVHNQGLVEIYFRASDNGNPPLEAHARLFIQFKNTFTDNSDVDFALKGVFSLFHSNRHPWILLVVLLALTVCVICVCIFVAAASAKRSFGRCCVCRETDVSQKTGKSSSNVSQLQFGPQLITEDGLVLDGQLSVLGKLYPSSNSNAGYSDGGSICRWNSDLLKYNIGSVGSPALCNISLLGSTIERMHRRHTGSEQSTTKSRSFDVVCPGSTQLCGENTNGYDMCAFSPMHRNTNRETKQFEGAQSADKYFYSNTKYAPTNDEQPVIKEQKQISEVDGGSADSGQGASEDEPTLLESWKNGFHLCPIQHNLNPNRNTVAGESTVGYQSLPHVYFNQYSDSAVRGELTTFAPSTHMIEELRSQQVDHSMCELKTIPPPPVLSTIKAEWKDPILCRDRYGRNNPKFEEFTPKVHNFQTRQSATLPPTSKLLGADDSKAQGNVYPSNRQETTGTTNRKSYISTTNLH